MLRANQTNCKSKNQLVGGICVIWGTLAILISSSSSWSRLFNLPNLLMFCWSSHVTSVSEPPPFSHSNHENRNAQNQKTEETEAVLGDKIEFLLTCCMFDWSEKVRQEKNQLHCSLYCTQPKLWRNPEREREKEGARETGCRTAIVKTETGSATLVVLGEIATP